MSRKYAVLISGDMAENGYEEFWFDVVLMHAALKNNGFSADNICVLYGNGSDYSNPKRPNPRYRPDPSITNFSATTYNVARVFEGLSKGTYGFPQMTDNDLLFVWTFDHGSIIPGHAILCLMDTNLRDKEFAALVNKIPHAYRIFCMQQCFSGGFIDDLRSDRTVILTACRSNEVATPADTENEVVDGVRYCHGEFNYHLLSALNGCTVTGKSINADIDGKGYVDLQDVFAYIQANESKPETPQYDDGSKKAGLKLRLLSGDLHMPSKHVD